MSGAGARTVRFVLVYFALVFATGFALGAIRVPLLVPRLGERWAELLEMPVMVAACWLAARWCTRRFTPLSRGRRLGAGMLALALLVAAELGLVVVVQDRGLRDYVAGRDPVSGTAYLLALCMFAVLPALVRPASPLSPTENP